jgi:hypothetical protein
MLACAWRGGYLEHTPLMAAEEMNRTSGAKTAEAVAIEALAFVANDPALLPRFLSMTGIEASAIRRAAMEPGFLAGVLDFIIAHEPTLMQFSEASGIAPQAVANARRGLPLSDDSHERSI